jgi:hypothetical protein
MRNIHAGIEVVNELSLLVVLITLSQKHQKEQSEDISTICNLLNKLTVSNEIDECDMLQGYFIQTMKEKYQFT